MTRSARRRNASSGTVLADLALNSVGFLTLLLIPLLFNIDQKGKQVSQLETTRNMQDGMLDELFKSEADKNEKAGKQEEVIQTQEREIEEQKHEINSLMADATNSRELIENGIPVDVVFLFDSSASMGMQIENVRGAISRVGQLLPRVARLRVGVLVFRNGEYRQFKLQSIETEKADNGASLWHLEKFLKKVQAQQGIVDVKEAAHRGMGMFSINHSGTVREILVLVSDVGPGDSPGPDMNDLSVMENSLRAWTSAPTHDRRFLALFSADDGQATLYNVEAHRNAYKRLAGIPNGRFEDQTAAVFPVLFETIFAPSKKQE